MNPLAQEPTGHEGAVQCSGCGAELGLIPLDGVSEGWKVYVCV